MAIISVRVVSDMPAQSRYLPYISIYFILSLFFSFISFMWFILCDKFKISKSLPNIIIKIIRFLKHSLNNKVKSNSKTNQQNGEINYEDYISTLNRFVFLVILISSFVPYLTLWILMSQ